MLGFQNLHTFGFTSSIKDNVQCYRVCLFLPSPSCHMWRLQCPTPPQSTTLFMCFPLTWKASWDTSNAKLRTSLKVSVSSWKLYQKCALPALPSLTVINCRSLLPAKQVALRTAKLQLREARCCLVALLPSPSCAAPFLPVSNTSTEEELQVPLRLLLSPGFHSSFHHRGEDGGTRVNPTKWGLTRGKLELI